MYTCSSPYTNSQVRGFVLHSLNSSCYIIRKVTNSAGPGARMTTTDKEITMCHLVMYTFKKMLIKIAMAERSTKNKKFLGK